MPPKHDELEPLDASENFRLWFGASKVVDSAGKPLVVYHGGKKPVIKEFKNKHGVHYFSPNMEHAQMFAMEHGHRAVVL